MGTAEKSVMLGIKGKEGMNNQSAEDSQSNETLLYDSMMVHVCHYTFFQIHTPCSSRSEP